MGTALARVLVALATLPACGRFGFDEASSDAACTLALAPIPRVNLESTRTIVPINGTPPYAFTASGRGTITPAGQFASGGQPGDATILVTDAGGCVAKAELAIGGDSLWYVGGASMSIPTAEVWKSTDGRAWTQVGALPDKRTSGALLVLDDQLFWISGSDGVGPKTAVFASRDGVVWTKVGDVPIGGTNFGHAVHDKQLWMVGGNGNADNVYASTDGVTWRTAGHLPMDNHGGSLSSAGGRLWYAGGHNNSLYDWVLSSSDGVAWVQTGTLPRGREYHAAITIESTFILVGGQNTVPTALTDVTTTNDGQSFDVQTPLPVGRAFGTLALFRERLWSVGGNDGGGVWSAAPGDAWTMETTNFPAPRQGGGLALFTPLP